MKKTVLFLLLFSVLFSCSDSRLKNAVVEDPSRQNLYKIPVDSLKIQAVKLAEIFGERKTRGKSISVKDVISVNSLLVSKGETKVGDNDEVSKAYIINFDNDAGFAILADDSRFANNVLAYSDNGNVDNSIDNPGLLLFMYDAAEYLEVQSRRFKIIEAPYVPGNYEPNKSQKPYNWGSTSSAQRKWVYNDNTNYVEFSRVSPLLTVNWGQSYPYNQATPVENGRRCVTGCVATAAVQIMSYHNWPTSVTTLGSNWNIDWLSAKNGDILGANIHYLMRSTGDLVYMNYGVSASGAQSSYIPSMLSNYGYTSTNLLSYNSDIVKSEIDNSRPVYARGQDLDKGVGHAWVVDGYVKCKTPILNTIDYVDDSDIDHPILIGQKVTITYSADYFFFHCNWGWNGRCNGYFLNFNVSEGSKFDNPNDQPLSSSYEYNKEVICKIKH